MDDYTEFYKKCIFVYPKILEYFNDLRITKMCILKYCPGIIEYAIKTICFNNLEIYDCINCEKILNKKMNTNSISFYILNEIIYIETIYITKLNLYKSVLTIKKDNAEIKTIIDQFDKFNQFNNDKCYITEQEIINIIDKFI